MTTASPVVEKDSLFYSVTGEERKRRLLLLWLKVSSNMLLHSTEAIMGFSQMFSHVKLS